MWNDQTTWNPPVKNPIYTTKPYVWTTPKPQAWKWTSKKWTQPTQPTQPNQNYNQPSFNKPTSNQQPYQYEFNYDSMYGGKEDRPSIAYADSAKDRDFIDLNKKKFTKV